MKRLPHSLFIAVLVLTLTACAGAPDTQVHVPPPPAIRQAIVPDTAGPSTQADESTPAQPAKTKAATKASMATEPAAEIQLKPMRPIVKEEEVEPPILEADERALIEQGRQALERGQTALALSLLTSAIAQLEPGTPDRLEAAELLTTLYLDKGHYAEAFALITGLGQPLNACLLRSLAMAAEVEGLKVATVQAYLELLGVVDEMEYDELNRRIGYLMDGLGEPELEQLSATRLFTRIGGYATLKLAKLRIAQNLPDEAEPLLWRLQFLFAGDPIGESADAQVRRLVASRTQRPGHFGVMLPLSGKLSLFGERVLRGILLSSDLLSKTDPTEDSAEDSVKDLAQENAQPLILHIFDTRGDPEKARQGVIELADKGVIGIIGPLKGNVAQAAAEEARALGVPLLTPTPTAEVEGDGVFRLGLRPEDEIDRLARYAIEERGIERFAILAPDTDRGRNYRKIFWDSVIRHGGEIAGAALFEPGKNINLKASIEKLTGIHKLTKAEHRERFDEMRFEELSETAALLIKLGISPRGAAEAMAVDEAEEYAEYEPKPRVDFTGVFLPTGSKDAALLAPQLPYHDVFDATLLGLRSWNHPTLVEVGREYVNGALIPVEWNVTTPEGQAFAQAYKGAYRRDPGVLEVYGFDAGTLALSASLKGAAVSRDEFQLLLARLWAQKAVTGPLTTHPSGVIASEPKILTVKRGRLIVAPTSESN